MIDRIILVFKNVNIKKISNIMIDQLSGDIYIYINTNLVNLIKG